MKPAFSPTSVRSLLKRITGVMEDRCIVPGGSCRFSSHGCPSACWMGRVDGKIASYNLDVQAMAARRRRET